MKNIFDEPTEHRIRIQATINASISDVWNKWNTPESICQWNFAADTWHAPMAENDPRVGGTFNIRMEAKDGSFGFNLKGTYTEVEENGVLHYNLEDNRKVSVHFSDLGDSVVVTQSFEPETQNSEELQQAGWQAILDNFKKHCEETV